VEWLWVKNCPRFADRKKRANR